MGKCAKRPKNAISVTTYADLDRYVGAFAAGHLNLLILVGRPGVQKSQAVRCAIGKGACWIEGHATPFGIYVMLWQYRDQPVVIDDVDGLHGSREGLRLLKCLCQTEPRKTVSWQSNAVALITEGIPRQFTTASRVAIVCNQWRTLSDNVEAVEDRGICISFEPSPLEVHVRTGAWFWDQEIFDFIAEHLHCFVELSMRLYRHAWELKNAGLDWRGYILERTLNPTARLVAALRADGRFASEEDRVKAFTAQGGGSRATYFKYAKGLKPTAAAPRIVLTKPAPKETLDDEALVNLLRRRVEPTEEC